MEVCVAKLGMAVLCSSMKRPAEKIRASLGLFARDCPGAMPEKREGEGLGVWSALPRKSEARAWQRGKQPPERHYGKSGDQGAEPPNLLAHGNCRFLGNLGCLGGSVSLWSYWKQSNCLEKRPSGFCGPGPIEMCGTAPLKLLINLKSFPNKVGRDHRHTLS